MEIRNRDFLRTAFTIGLLNLSKIFPAVRNFVIYHPKWIEISLTSKCCLKCKMCNYWKLLLENELSFEEIKDILDQAVNLGIRICHLYGGEPFMRKDIFEIFHYAKSLDLTIDITSNGYLINEDVAKDLSEIPVRNVNISIDGLEKIHDTVRGVEGSFKKAIEAVSFLKQFNVKISVAILLMKINLEDIIPLIKKLKMFKVPISLQLLDFSPFYFKNNNLRHELWIDETEQPILDNLVKELIAIKKQNPCLISNSFLALNYIKGYFKDPKMAKVPCYLVYLGRIWVSSQGNIHICQSLPAVGNIRKNRLEDAIRSKSYLKKLQSCFLKKCPGCSCGYSVNVTANLSWKNLKFITKIIKEAKNG